MRRLKAAIPGKVPARERVVQQLRNLLGHQHCQAVPPKGPAGPGALEEGHAIWWIERSPYSLRHRAQSLCR